MKPRPAGRLAKIGLLILTGCGSTPGNLDAGARADATPARDGGVLEVPDASPPDATAPPRDAGPANQPPTVLTFAAAPAEGLVPLEVWWSWSVQDPDDDPLTCRFDPDGDGPAPERSLPCTQTSSTSARYEAEGRFVARLTVQDPRGAEDVAEVEVRAQRPFALPTYLDADFAASGTAVPDLDGIEAGCGVSVAAVDGDDVTDALRTAIGAAAARVTPTGHCVVRLPAGAFEVRQTVDLSDGVVLRGQGASRTTVTARLTSAAPAFRARGGAASVAYEGEQVRGIKGERRLTVTATLAREAIALGAGSTPVYAELSIDNDPVKFPSEWQRDYAAFGIGQVFRVTGVEADQLLLDRPLNEPYVRAGLVRRLELRGPDRMLERAGLADLRVIRADTLHAGTIGFDRTADAFLLRVAVEKTGWAHVHVDRSLSCSIRHSYFSDAHDFGDGGRGYGVNLRHHTTGCRIEDNAFRRLRHAMILQLGSNANVIAYNYAEDSRDNLSWLKADVSLHGHYTHMNLIEGNVVEKIHVSDWWGPAPFHVVFNNRVSRGGIYVDDRSHDTAVIDNVSEANFPLERPLQVHSSVRSLLCVHNASPDGVPLSSSHSDCDDENDPAVIRERPRPPSWYRAESLMSEDGTIPAQRRLAAGTPVPPPP